MQSREKKIDSLRREYNFSELGLYLVLYKRYSGLQIDKGIRYSPKGKRTYLDIVCEKDRPDKKRPLLIYIHGGGWVSGLRTARLYYCENWTKQGYVCANIGYDYANDAKHPGHLRQIFKGIEWVLDHADVYGIDTERIVVAGESAGAYFSAFVGAVTTHRALYKQFGIAFKYQESFQANACVLISGIYDPARSLKTEFKDIGGFVEALCGLTPEELQSELGAEKRSFLAPASYADVHFPPSFIIGSKKDLLLPESEALHSALNMAGVKNRYFLCSGINGVHAGGLLCQVGAGKEAVQQAQCFVLEVLRDKEHK